MTGGSAAQYILHGGVRRVRGWLASGAVTATLFLNDWQRRSGIRGNVAEIGIHHGKFFLVLKNLCESDEIAIAIDVFEDQSLNVDQSGRGDKAVFESNIFGYSDGKNIKIIQGDSKLISPEQILAAGGGRPIRIFSIDGSHTMEHTLSDLKLAGKILADGGVMVLDDLYSQDWPGVQEGFHHFMSEAGYAFAPLALGDNKLFLCKRSDHRDMLPVFKEELRPYYLAYKDVVLWGADAVSMSLQPPEDVFTEDLKPAQNVFFLCKETLSARCSLLSGWSYSESNGTWTVGERALIEMRLIAPPVTGEAQLQMELVPLLHSRRSSRKLSVFVNDSFVGGRELNNVLPEKIEFAIDAAMLRETTTVALEVESPEKPSEVGLNDDQRPLGIKVRSIKFAIRSEITSAGKPP